MVRWTLEDHGWWRRSTPDEQEKIRNDFWAAGRLSLEAWLGPRVHQPNIHIYEKTAIVAAHTAASGTYDILLDNYTTVNVHHIILATGYLPNMQMLLFSTARRFFENSKRLATFQCSIRNFKRIYQICT